MPQPRRHPRPTTWDPAPSWSALAIPLLALLVLLAGVLVAPATAAPDAPAPDDAAAAPRQVVAYFTRGEHFVRVARRAEDPSLDAALRALLAGPTPAELRAGIRSSVPRGVGLRSARVTAGVARVDVSAGFGEGPPGSLRTRLAQLVYTATGLDGVRAVSLAVDGTAVTRLGGLSLEPALTRASFAAPPIGGGAPEPTLSEPSALVRAVQRRLVALGYLPAGADDGIAGPQTRHAVLAFQSWERRPRDGRVTAALKVALDGASRPVVRRGPARRIEVSLARQVTLFVEGGRVTRAIHVSTGKPSSPTPPGRFRVFRKELRSWSVPFQVWLPYASYFNNGIAFHESADVPTFPASAGCVRIPASESREVYAFATVGTVVIVRRD